MADSAENKDPLADTNMENYGGEEHRKKQQEIAKKQKEWKHAGKEVGIETWRIENFEVVPQKNFHGDFYDGNSYIVLNTYLNEEEMAYNVHFWLGKDTSQDEAGAAAIKTVELDDLLGDLPVQYREVQGNESKLFRRCFPNGIRTLSGGVDSGFTNVKPEVYAPRLLHVHGSIKDAVISQVPLSVDSLNSSDVFVLDLGLELIQFNGTGANPGEKRVANEFMNQLASERNGKVKSKSTMDQIKEEGDYAKKFWAIILGAEDAEPPESLPEESLSGKVQEGLDTFYSDFTKALYVVENDEVTKKQEGGLDKSILAEENDNAIIVDTGKIIYLWMGKKSTTHEKGEAMRSAMKMLDDQERPKETQIIRIVEGKETDQFNSSF